MIIPEVTYNEIDIHAQLPAILYELEIYEIHFTVYSYLQGDSRIRKPGG